MSRVILKPVKQNPAPKKKRGRFLQLVIVTLGAMFLAALAIHANDTFNPQGKNLLAGVGASTKEAVCPNDMVYVSSPGGGFCIDRYENSPGKSCPHSDPSNQFETTDNLSRTLCTPVSLQNVDPWVNVPESQAVELCARAGKHLPNNNEWYRAALGTPDEGVDASGNGCVIGRVGATGAEKTGVHSNCVSSSGAYDMIGNVWEWVDANAVNGQYGGRSLPDEGYVSEADVDGVAIKTSSTSEPIFHGDYFYVNKDAVNGMFRGGFWALSDKAGATAVNAENSSSFVGVAVGFRCAR